LNFPDAVFGNCAKMLVSDRDATPQWRTGFSDNLSDWLIAFSTGQWSRLDTEISASCFQGDRHGICYKNMNKP
jgi:hypothetical protein